MSQEIAEFCRKLKVTELALFGSVVSGEFRSTSDVDVLVTFAEDARWSLFDIAEMQDELRSMFGRGVDLVTRRGLENSRNPLRRESILSSTRVIYAAG